MFPVAVTSHKDKYFELVHTVSVTGENSSMLKKLKVA